MLNDRWSCLVTRKKAFSESILAQKEHGNTATTSQRNDIESFILNRQKFVSCLFTRPCRLYYHKEKQNELLSVLKHGLTMSWTQV